MFDNKEITIENEKNPQNIPNTRFDCEMERRW